MLASEQQLSLAWIAEKTGAQEATSGGGIQSLWSGYGDICRVDLLGGGEPSVIVKRVTPPDARHHPRGWASDRSHQRKLRSYEVETFFYEQYAQQCAEPCRVPRCIATQRLVEPEGWVLLLEDLDVAGFPGRRNDVSPAEVEHCLTWLADFHAVFLGRAPAGLWPVGTYWHLETRPDELLAIEDTTLKRAAPLLDARLNACAHQTLVHGDAKLANFCFGERGVAAVDFQYVGGGAGVKDVAYFFSSCWDGEDCERLAAGYLDRYFQWLQERLAQRRPELDAATRANIDESNCQRHRIP